jgi:hypothetical protein
MSRRNPVYIIKTETVVSLLGKRKMGENGDGASECQKVTTLKWGPVITFPRVPGCMGCWGNGKKVKVSNQKKIENF